MSEKEKSILVTGGTGFIGSYLLRSLVEVNGYEVSSFSNEDPNPPIEGVIYNRGDIGNYNEVKDALGGKEVIVNLAAILGVFNSIRNPEEYVDVNVKGAINVLRAATHFQVERFIQASSDAIYGAYPLVDGGINEDFSPLTPPNPYAVSKLAQEYFCHSYFYTHNLPLIALRFSNVYGPRQREKNIIWTFIEDAANKKPLVIFGDGNHGRDFTYVQDAVQGIIRALNKGRVNEAYHISSGSFLRIKELASLVADNFPGTEIGYVEGNKAVVNQGFLNIDKAREELGYSVTTPPEEGILKCILWYKEEHGIES